MRSLSREGLASGGDGGCGRHGTPQRVLREERRQDGWSLVRNRQGQAQAPLDHLARETERFQAAARTGLEADEFNRVTSFVV